MSIILCKFAPDFVCKREMTKQVIVTTADEQALDEVTNDDPSIRKVIYNGQVYILRVGNTYTLTGTEIK